MKKLAFVILCVFGIILNCRGQKGKEPREQCALCNHATTHQTDSSHARELIQAFQEKFQMIDSTVLCGGTIYMDENIFKMISTYEMSDNDHLIFNFQYCLPSENSNDPFLIFTNANCDPEVKKEKGYIKPSDTFGPFFKPSDPRKDYNYALYQDQKKPVYLPLNSQVISNSSAHLARLNFANTKAWTDYLTISEYSPYNKEIYEGYFFYYSGIHSLVSTPNCAGIRYYFGFYEESPCGNKIRVVLCAVDKDGKNIPGTWRENSNLVKRVGDYGSK